MSNYTDEFYEEYYKDSKYSRKEISSIIQSPFLMFKDKLSDGKLKNIRFKYFGVFKFSRGKFAKAYENLLKKKDVMLEREFNRKVKMYEDNL